MSTVLRGVENILQPLLSTTGNGIAATLPASATKHVVIAKGTGVVSGGIISIEEADVEDYAGTWSVITTVTASNLDGGAIQVVHIDGLLRAIRARISTNIAGGGSISVVVVSALQ